MLSGVRREADLQFLLAAVVVLIVAVVLIAVLHRYYVKGSRDVALIRTGAGASRVVVDGGCLALPFLHRTEQVSLRAVRLTVSRSAGTSLITADRMRVDLEMEFHLRAEPSEDGIRRVAQVLGGRGFRADALQDLIEGQLLDAMQSVVAARRLDELHEARREAAEAVGEVLRPVLALSGLQLDSVSLTRLDQTPFSALDENNAFNAVGMRRLAEVVAANRKQRVEIEAEADVSVRRSQLEQARQRLRLEQEQKEAEIAQRHELQRLEAETEAVLAQTRAESERASEAARIQQDLEVKAAEINRDRSLREREMAALLAVESGKVDNAIALAAKRAEENRAAAEAEDARSAMVLASEQVLSRKELAVAERAREVALVKLRERSEIASEEARVEADSRLAQARAEAEARQMQAAAQREGMLAEAEGQQALIAASNGQSDALIDMKVEMHRLDRLPEIAAELVKPVEKIDSIRINQIAGLNGNGGPGEGGGSVFDQALNSILGMAVHLPAMKKLGEEIGVDMDTNLATRTSDAINRGSGRKSG